MTAFLCLLLAVTATGNSDHTEKKSSVGSVAQTILPEALPLQSFVDGISSLGASIGSQVTSDDDATSAAVPGTVVWVRLSKDFLGDYLERDVDRTKPVRDYILGTRINGSSRTTGKTRLVLQPNEDRAKGRVEFVGEVHGREIGHNGPATLHFKTASTFRAHKLLTMTEAGIVASPAVAHATTRLTPTSIYTSLPGLRGRIGQRIARRREAASRSQANAIASDHTADDIRQGFDKRLNDALAEIQSGVRTEIAGLKFDNDDSPLKLRSRSTAAHIEVALCRGTIDADEWRQIAASVDGTPDVAVRVHRSLLSRALGDAKLREKLMPLIGNVSQPQMAGTSLKIEKWAIGDPWVTLDLASGEQPDSTTRVAAEELLQR